MKIEEATLPVIIRDGINLCRTELRLTNLPKIELVDKIDNNSFGIFDGESIKVVIKNRHPIDIIRTLAHELVHWKQKQTGQELDGSDGSSTENDANAVAGIIMRKFGKMYPEYFLDSLP